MKILLAISLYRLYVAISLFLGSTSLTRGAVQSQEYITNPLIFISKSISLFYPYILIVILVSLFQSIKRAIPSNTNTAFAKAIEYLVAKQKLLVLTIISSVSAAILLDLARSSRGSFFLTIASFILAYCISPPFRIRLRLTKSIIMSFLFIAIISLSTISMFSALSLNRHYRDCTKVKCETDYSSYLTILHDTSLLKVVGGQMVTAQALSGKLTIVESKDLTYRSEFRDYVKSLDFSSAAVIDKFCARTSCLSLIQPLSRIARLAGVHTPTLYFLIIGQYPYNSSAHIAASFIAFPFPISFLMYVVPIYTFCLLSSRAKPQSIFPKISLAMFVCFLFTDNYLFSWQAASSILLYVIPVPLYKKFGLMLA